MVVRGRIGSFEKLFVSGDFAAVHDVADVCIPTRHIRCLAKRTDTIQGSEIRSFHYKDIELDVL